MWRFVFLAFAVVACTRADPETDPKVDLGDFQLGHNVVVTAGARQIGPSRNATPDEWEAVLKDAITARFGGYRGGKLYHIGINLDGYALALPGVPVVLSPKSAMVVSVNVWDDAAGVKLNDKPRQMSVFEQFDGDTVIGSGLTQTREEQMDNLARNMARAVERYMVENANWFGATGLPVENEAQGAILPATPGQIETSVLPGGSGTVAGTITAAQATGLTRPVQRPARSGIN